MPVNILHACSDVLWPRRCEICDRPVDRPARHVCADCLNRLPFMPKDGLCRVCGREAVGLEGEYLCEECRFGPKPRFDRAGGVFRFEGDARALLLRFKFHRHLWLRDDFVDGLEVVARLRFRLDAVDLLVPIPSTRWHRFLRGYSPCDILATALAHRLGKPCATNVVRRIGSPRRQSGLTEEDRRKNVIGTFAVRRPAAVAGKTVLVVDDVMTTGSTLSECAATLKSAGARRVFCLTVAHTCRF